MVRSLAVDLRLLVVAGVVGLALRGRRDWGLLDATAPVHAELPHLLNDVPKFAHQGCRDCCCDELRSREGSALEPGDQRRCVSSSR